MKQCMPAIEGCLKFSSITVGGKYSSPASIASPAMWEEVTSRLSRRSPARRKRITHMLRKPSLEFF